MIIIFKIQGRYLIFWKILSSVLFIFVSFDSNSFQHPTVCRRTKQIIHNFTCEQAGAISHTTSRPNPAHQTILSASMLALPALLPCSALDGELDSWQSITDSGSGAWTNDVNVVLLNNPRVESCDRRRKLRQSSLTPSPLRSLYASSLGTDLISEKLVKLLQWIVEKEPHYLSPSNNFIVALFEVFTMIIMIIPDDDREELRTENSPQW